VPFEDKKNKLNFQLSELGGRSSLTPPNRKSLFQPLFYSPLFRLIFLKEVFRLFLGKKVLYFFRLSTPIFRNFSSNWTHSQNLKEKFGKNWRIFHQHFLFSPLNKWFFEEKFSPARLDFLEFKKGGKEKKSYSVKLGKMGSGEIFSIFCKVNRIDWTHPKLLSPSPLYPIFLRQSEKGRAQKTLEI
jgi:hypothetical protein